MSNYAKAANLGLTNMWVAFASFAVAALLGLYQVVERIDLVPALKSPELYFGSVSTHGVLMGFVLTTFFIVGFRLLHRVDQPEAGNLEQAAGVVWFLAVPDRCCAGGCSIADR